jgi:ketosteroid isomerase-like protein
MYRKRLFSLAGVLLVAVALGGCLIYPTPTPQGAEEEAFLEAVWAHELAWEANDVDATIAFYDEDAISLLPGLPTIEGKEAIEADMRAFLDMFTLERVFELVDYTVSGDYATRLGEWTNTMKPKDGSDPIVEKGRCIVGWRNIGGEWKVVWEIASTY